MRTATAAMLCAAGLSSVVTSQAQAADFEVGALALTANNGDPNDVYYPVIDPDEVCEEFPMVVILPGGSVDKSQYSDYATELASRGHIVAVANHLRVLGPPGTPAGNFVTVNSMVASMQLLQAQDADPTSPLHEIVDEENLAIQGHSYGGGVALYAVEGTCGPNIPGLESVFCDVFGPPGTPPVPYFKPVELKAAVSWATSGYVRGGGGPPVLLDPETSETPVVIFSGANDSGSPVSDAMDTYPLLDGTKAVLEFAGLTHWGIANEEAVEDPTSPRFGDEPDISKAKGHRRIARWTKRFLKAHLYGSKRALKRIYVRQKSGPNVEIVASELVE